MSGMLSKRKGYEFERELVNHFRAHGLTCRRVPLSGAGDEKGDLCVTPGFDASVTYRGEAKRRKNLPEWIKNALGDHQFMAMRCDRGETLVVIKLGTFTELMQ